MGLSNELYCEAGSFSCCCLNPRGCFQSEVRGFISSCWSPGLLSLFRSLPFLPVYLCTNVAPLGLLIALPAPLHNPTTSLGPPSATLPQVLSLFPGCPSPPLLPVRMNVSSLSPWLSDFHAVQFSVSSGCFLFLNCCCPSFGCVRGAVCLPMPPSWSEAPDPFFILPLKGRCDLHRLYFSGSLER